MMITTNVIFPIILLSFALGYITGILYALMPITKDKNNESS